MYFDCIETNGTSDEILYDARIHPEQYSNTLTPAQIAQLHRSIHYVCKFSVDNLADSSKFPEEWLFKHRWSKGKKDSVTTLPNGSKFVFLTVGGRTSCVVPSVQKKTGPVAGGVQKKSRGDHEDEEETKPEPKKGKKASKAAAKVEEDDAEEPAVKPSRGKKRALKQEEQPARNGAQADDDASTPAKKKRKSAAKDETNGTSAKKEKTAKVKTNGAKTEPEGQKGGRRRSTRVTGMGV